MTTNATNVIANDMSILLGPAGLMGTVALCNVVKAGVFSCILAKAACFCVFIDE